MLKLKLCSLIHTPMLKKCSKPSLFLMPHIKNHGLWASSWCDNFHFRKLSNVENELYKSRNCIVSFLEFQFLANVSYVEFWKKKRFDLTIMVKWPNILCENISSRDRKTFKFMNSTFMNRKYMQYITVHFQWMVWIFALMSNTTAL